jgi:FkbM family methyltransferase
VDECKENIRHYACEGITIIKAALSDKASTNSTFYSSYGQAEWITDRDTGNKSSSLLEPKEHIGMHKWCKFKQEQVNVVTLDSCLGEPFFVAPFDFIHIDVQGNELAVFRGGEEMLRHCTAVWCEVANIELYKGQALKKDVVDFMVARGFYVMKDTCGTKAAGDVLFVKVGK